MFEYEFPMISNIEQVRTAIAGRDEFKEIDKGDYIAFDYVVNFEDTFPPIYQNEVFDYFAAIRRECRGIIFDKMTGVVIRRPFHKFFNLNERLETQMKNLDFLKNNVVLEKLDGSMIAPFRVIGHDEILWGTKKGETLVSENVKTWIKKKPHYEQFASNMIDMGFTPIFEWCSRKNRIVIDYPEDRLVLTAVRNMVSGEYWTMNEMMMARDFYKIEIMEFHYLMNVYEVLEKISSTDLEGHEGYIIRFNDTGHMVKIKGSWYLQLHKTLEHIQQEKDLLRLILDNKIDDAKPFLPVDLVGQLDKYAEGMFKNMRHLASEYVWDAVAIMDTCNKSKKEFAAQVKGKKESGIYFKIFDYFLENSNIQDAIEYTYGIINDKIMSNLSTQSKVDSVRHLIGVKWEI